VLLAGMVNANACIAAAPRTMPHPPISPAPVHPFCTLENVDDVLTVYPCALVAGGGEARRLEDEVRCAV